MKAATSIVICKPTVLVDGEDFARRLPRAPAAEDDMTLANRGCRVKPDWGEKVYKLDSCYRIIGCKNSAKELTCLGTWGLTGLN